MFFFFKQKTAYEMRISDWSSDVCSSDLFTVLNDERIIGVQYLNNAHSHIPFYFGISNDDTSAEHSKSPAETIQPLADFASFLMNIHIKACRKNVWGTTYRSEEHTSELQSLMRISYAVFCLKKTITTRQHC